MCLSHIHLLHSSEAHTCYQPFAEERCSPPCGVRGRWSSCWFSKAEGYLFIEHEWWTKLLEAFLIWILPDRSEDRMWQCGFSSELREKPWLFRTLRCLLECGRSGNEGNSLSDKTWGHSSLTHQDNRSCLDLMLIQHPSDCKPPLQIDCSVGRKLWVLTSSHRHPAHWALVFSLKRNKWWPTVCQTLVN